MGRHRLPHTRKARCHPTRWAVYLDYCADCMPVIPTFQREECPTPTTCPHCRARPPAWHCDPFGGRCVLCGARWERLIVPVYV